MLGNSPAHPTEVADIEISFKFCPGVFDMKVGLAELQLLTFATETCRLGRPGEQPI